MKRQAREIHFVPCPLLDGRHRQTIGGTILHFSPFIPISRRRLVSLNDGDFLSLEISTPRKWTQDKPIVVLLHGLCGSHRSPGMARLTRKLMRQNYKVIRVNLRGCGSGKGYARRMYHSGSSGDIAIALKEVKRLHPSAPIILIGFSLGGNIALKLAGELGKKGTSLMHSVIAVSPPVDLHHSVQMLNQESNRLYERYFVRLLRADVHFRHRYFDDLPDIFLPRDLTLFEFDDIYIAPQSGFATAFEYYTASSSKKRIHAITIPTYILFAKDDPVVHADALDDLSLPHSVTIAKSTGGGHLGFLGHPRGDGGFYWIDSVILEQIKRQLRKIG